MTEMARPAETVFPFLEAKQLECLCSSLPSTCVDKGNQ